MRWNKTDGTYRKYTVEDGLADNYCSDIAVDQNGVIWISANDVLSCFDGETWIKYNTENTPFPINQVGHIAVDKENAVWVEISGFGMFSFDGEEWKSHRSEEGSVQWAEMIYVDEHNVKWFSYYTGVRSYNGTTRVNHSIEESGIKDNRVNCFAIDHEGVKWFGTVRNGVFRFDIVGV